MYLQFVANVRECKDLSSYLGSATGSVAPENPIRRRNPGAIPNRSTVGACVVPYDYCCRPYEPGFGPGPSSSLRSWPSVTS